MPASHALPPHSTCRPAFRSLRPWAGSTAAARSPGRGPPRREYRFDKKLGQDVLSQGGSCADRESQPADNTETRSPAPRPGGEVVFCFDRPLLLRLRATGAEASSTRPRTDHRRDQQPEGSRTTSSINRDRPGGRSDRAERVRPLPAFRLRDRLKPPGRRSAQATGGALLPDTGGVGLFAPETTDLKGWNRSCGRSGGAAERSPGGRPRAPQVSGVPAGSAPPTSVVARPTVSFLGHGSEPKDQPNSRRSLHPPDFYGPCSLSFGSTRLRPAGSHDEVQRGGEFCPEEAGIVVDTPPRREGLAGAIVRCLERVSDAAAASAAARRRRG